ncbi:hypothetical protein O181_007849 [Austropuccinia psidii MF-1]|uniref:Uncharacterized protein n=1 Tax=Austropuccinia psidii MF-1 TaxID=1389203 RepID=A0A9Q3BLN7_9BASI|nr:hypothetical protein [Austropuccinia psidii MF-1]
MRCIIARSNIPTYLWDEAASHASFLLNQLPHKFLNFKSPVNKLDEFNSRIEPKIDLNRILPFGMKVVVKANAKSNSLRVLDLKTGKIKITPDYTVSHNPVSSAIRQSENISPHKSSTKLILKLPKQNATQKIVSSLQPNITEHQELIPTASTNKTKDKHYNYVPYYDQPPNPVSSNISPNSIVDGKRSRKIPDRLMLTDSVPYNQAMNDSSAKVEWKKRMDDEFKSLMTHNTGELVPYQKKK